MKERYILALIFLALGLQTVAQQDTKLDSSFLRMSGSMLIYQDEQTSQIVNAPSSIAYLDSLQNHLVSFEVIDTIPLIEGLVFVRFFRKSVSNTKAEYIVAFTRFNTAYQFKLKGFQENDYMKFFRYLEKRMKKSLPREIKRPDVNVPGLDLICLYELYRKGNYKPGFNFSEAEKRAYPCLNHNYQTIITY